MAAAPSYCVILDDDDITCPVCYEVLRDPTTATTLDCPHVCCSLCLQSMSEGVLKCVDCPKCCHINREPKVPLLMSDLDDDFWLQNERRYKLRLSRSTDNLEIPDSEYFNEKDTDNEKTEDDGASSDIVNNNLQVPIMSYNGTPKTRKRSSHDVLSGKDEDTVEATGKKYDGSSESELSDNEDSSHHDTDLRSTNTPDNFDSDPEVTEARKLKDVVNEATKAIQEQKKNLKELKDLQKLMETHLKVQQKVIEKQAEHVIRRIQEESMGMIVNLEKNVMPRIESVKDRRAQLKKEVGESKDALVKLEQDIDRANRVEIDQVESPVSIPVDSKTSGDLVMGMAKFVYGKPFDLPKLFGSLLPIEKVKCTLVNEFGAFQLASAISATPHGLLVSDYSSNKVYVYSDPEHGQYRNVSCLDLSSKTTSSPYGVAVTAEGRYLVARFKHVEVYSPSGKYQGVLKVRPSGERGIVGRHATGIETMADGSVVISDLYNSTLTVISKDGGASKTIQCSVKPVRITTRFNGYALVNFWKDGKICLINLELGKEVQVFDIPHSSAVCYHKETDSLFVARCLGNVAYGMPKPGTGSIEQYCATTGKYVGRIAEGLYMPRDFAVTPDGLLAVADTESVKLYKISGQY